MRVAVYARVSTEARSVEHLVSALEDFRTLGVQFISLQEQFDTSTPIGQAIFTIMASDDLALSTDAVSAVDAFEPVQLAREAWTP